MLRIFLLLLSTLISQTAFALVLTEAEQSWVDQHPNIQYSAQGALPPISMVEQSGYSGITGDLLTLIQLDPAWPELAILQSTEQPIKKTVQQADLIGGVTKVDRDGEYLYSDPYLTLPTVVIASDQQGNQVLNQDRIRLAVPVDSFDLAGIQALYPEWTVVPVPDHKMAIGMVSHRLIDRALTYEAALVHYVDSLKLAVEPRIIDEGKPSLSFYFAVRSDWPELVTLLDKSLKKLLPEQKQDLQFRWMKQQDAKTFWEQKTYEEWMQISLIASAVVLFVWVLYLLLRLRIRTASLLSIEKDNAEMKETLALLQTTDSVTGIANRKTWLDEASRELTRYHRYGNDFAVLLLVLDGFKEVRQEFGQSVADELIRYLVTALKEQLRDHDICGRMSSDELAVLLHGVTPDLAESVAQRITAKVNERGYSSSLGQHQVTVRSGIALPRAVSVTIDEVLNRADSKLNSD